MAVSIILLQVPELWCKEQPKLLNCEIPQQGPALALTHSFACSLTNVADGWIIPQMRIVRCVPAKTHRRCQLCFAKGRLRHMELSFGLSCMVQIVAKRTGTFFSSLWYFSERFLGHGGQRDSPIYSNHFSPFRNTFFQFDFKVVGNMLFTQTLYQRWKGCIWSGSIPEPGEPHGVRFMSVWTWVQLSRTQTGSSSTVISEISLLECCCIFVLVLWACVNEVFVISFANWSSLQY